MHVNFQAQSYHRIHCFLKGHAHSTTSVIFVLECLHPVLKPETSIFLILFDVHLQCVDSILRFVQDFTMQVEGVGDVCRSGPRSSRFVCLHSASDQNLNALEGLSRQPAPLTFSDHFSSGSHLRRLGGLSVKHHCRHCLILLCKYISESILKCYTEKEKKHITISIRWLSNAKVQLPS